MIGPFGRKQRAGYEDLVRFPSPELLTVSHMVGFRLTLHLSFGLEWEQESRSRQLDRGDLPDKRREERELPASRQLRL